MSGPALHGKQLFISGHHFEAHEAWETGWKDLSSPLKEGIKVWILLCGIIVLMEKSRKDPARRLALRAIELLDHLKSVSPENSFEEVKSHLRKFLLDENIQDLKTIRPEFRFNPLT